MGVADYYPVAAVEVYPAATLIAHGIQGSCYKKANHLAERGAIIERLRSLVTLPADTTGPRASADALDAVVCVVAVRDFLIGDAMPPSDRCLAEGEGWISTRAIKWGMEANRTL